MSLSLSEKSSYFHSVTYFGVFTKWMGGVMATLQANIMGSMRKYNHAAQAESVLGPEIFVSPFFVFFEDSFCPHVSSK